MSTPQPALPFSKLVNLTQQAVAQTEALPSWATFPADHSHRQPALHHSATTECTAQALICYEVFLFVLIWLQKQNYLQSYVADDVAGVSSSRNSSTDDNTSSIAECTISSRAQEILRNLAEWGEMIKNLQDGDPVEWELLRFQMEKAVRRYAPEFDDALQDALLKVHDILTRLPEHGSITKYLPIDEFLQIDARFRSIYDYGSPFYAYAKVVARNELIGQLRKQQRRPVYDLPIEEMHVEARLSYVAEEATVSIEEREQAVIEQLGVDMTRLLQTIHSLSPKQQLTTLPTLASREQFWRAAELVGVSISTELNQYKQMNSDAELSIALGMTENNLRVHRQHAKKRIQAKEPMLAELFERLITKHESSA